MKHGPGIEEKLSEGRIGEERSSPTDGKEEVGASGRLVGVG